MTIGIISGPVDIGGVAAVIRVAASESEEVDDTADIAGVDTATAEEVDETTTVR